MTVAHELATLAVAPVSAEDADRLRALTLTNLAAGLGVLGGLGRVVNGLPLDDRNPGDAAYRHAMRLHTRTQDDFHPAGRVHVGAITLAVTLALADRAHTRLLDCLSAGYKTMCAIAVVYAGEAQRRGYRPTGVFGPIGAAASAAVAIGLDRDGIANAMALAAARSGGTNQSWISGTDEWLLEVGAAARSGVEAALFTAAGVAASSEAFEGAAGWGRALFDDAGASKLVKGLTRGGSYISDVAVKPYPVSGIAQVPTDLACRAHGDLNGNRVRSAVLRLSEAESAYPGSANRGPFRSRSDALMSVGLCVACGLADGTVRLDRLERPNDLNELLAAVRLEPDASLRETQAVLVVELDDERREFVGDGASLLHPSWKALAADGDVVATRSEADPALVAQVLAYLQDDHPDARSVNAVTGGRP